MSKRYGLIIGSPEWVKVKEEEAAMEKKDDWKERFRTQFDHDNPFGRALVLITEEGQKPVGDDIEQFIQSEITKAKEEEKKRIAKAMEPAFEDFTAAGKLMIKSGVLENSGNEVIENIGYMKSVLI